MELLNTVSDTVSKTGVVLLQHLSADWLEFGQSFDRFQKKTHDYKWLYS